MHTRKGETDGTTHMQSAVYMPKCLVRAWWHLTCQGLFRERIGPSAQLCVFYGSRLKAGGNLAACVPGHVVQHYMTGWQSTFSGFNLQWNQSNRLNNKDSWVNKVSIYTDFIFSCQSCFPPTLNLGAFMESLCLDLSVPRSGCMRLPVSQTTARSLHLPYQHCLASDQWSQSTTDLHQLWFWCSGARGLVGNTKGGLLLLHIPFRDLLFCGNCFKILSHSTRKCLLFQRYDEKLSRSFFILKI